MDQDLLKESIQKLGDDFPNLPWNFRPDPSGGRNAAISQWLGEEKEEVMACLFKGKKIHEEFHRQDFFFINFAYQGDYQALSARFDNEITLKEGDCYIGQPYNGYALRGCSDDDIIIAGILIRKDVFFSEYLAPLTSEPEMLHFFLEPRVDRFSDEFIRLRIGWDDAIWDLLNMMIVEYAHKQEDTQKVMKALAFSMLMLLARKYSSTESNRSEGSLIDRILYYMERHLDSVTLSDLSSEFGYHPNYISSVLHKKSGSTFSQMLLKLRMQRAVLMMKHTELPIEQIADIVGYHNPSNFYKAFRTFYGVSPRNYLERV
jgi:AraC-like DNA-binding protein